MTLPLNVALLTTKLGLAKTRLPIVMNSPQYHMVLKAQVDALQLLGADTEGLPMTLAIVPKGRPNP